VVKLDKDTTGLKSVGFSSIPVRVRSGVQIIKIMEDKKYVLVMFPYPSGDGLHIGHCYNYLIMDSYCRWLNFKGIKTFQPFGYDAFGLPAENYAIKHNRDPKEVTYENIENFRRQINRMNTNFEEKIITADPSYYKWTQWLFTKMVEKGIAYKKFHPVNFCPSCKTVIANEQVKDNKCERCNSIVEMKELNQWFFKITDYKERLIKNLDTLDYPEKTKKQQKYWLENLNDWCVSRQRKWGCPIPIEGEEDTLDTFVDSSFYYLRYLTDSDVEFLPRVKYKQVDLYVGGNEHACMHLIYARFVNMFLYDLGIVEEEEPFKKLIHQGMIKMNGTKMSKSTGNVVNPDNYNSDELRFYLMFIGHYFDGGDWNDKNIIGITKFFNRFEKWTSINGDDTIDLIDFEEQINSFVINFKFNRVVSSFMEFYNKNKDKKFNSTINKSLRKMLSCFAPTKFT
jgi:leucyl-tRNA synthetase